MHEKLVLVVVLEGDQGFLDHTEAKNIHSVEVQGVDTGGVGFQDEVDVDLGFRDGTLADEDEFV